MAALLAGACGASAQTYEPPILSPESSNVAQQPNTGNVNLHLRLSRPTAPPEGFANVEAVTQEAEGSLRHLRGSVRLETQDELLTADEIDYNEDTAEAEARGHVKFESFKNGDKLQCDHAKYNLDTHEGTFYQVSGTSPAKIQARPGVLTSSNPFFFQAEWAQRIENQYILHNGLVTDCKVPRPWWTLTAPKFDVISEDRAIGYHAVFRLRGVPIFYFPAIYKSLKKSPRKSGFLTPNIGHSSLRGYMYGLGYFWAINRSYDALYRFQYFTVRGPAQTLDFRGKVKPGTDFYFNLYSVNDRGIPNPGSVVNSLGQVIPSPSKQGGVQFTFDGRSDLGNGWQARGHLDYLSSFLFRQSFTETFHEAIFSESHSVGYLTKHWSSYGLYVVGDRDQEFLTAAANDSIVIKKLPELYFFGRDKQIWNGFMPLWFSFDSSAGAMDRTQPQYQTGLFVDRLNLNPAVTTAFDWKGFHLTPSIAIHETQYGSSQQIVPANSTTSSPELFHITGKDVLRSAREVRLDIVLPSLERVFAAPKWLGGGKLKHVIETRAQYRYVDGVGSDFLRIIRFDQTDLLSNTNELRLSVGNRLFVKNKDGNVNEVLSWEISQSRYFDPTFGGAVIPGQLNIVQSVAELTGYSFLDGPRNYSPVISALRFQQKIGFEWRTDYDPLKGKIVNSTFNVDARFSNYIVSAGANELAKDPILNPNGSNQIRLLLGYGNDKRKGWNAAYTVFYDYARSIVQFSTAEVTRNTDCCGFSVEYRRFNIGSRDETQFRAAFAISNIGSFGTLKRQERLF